MEKHTEFVRELSNDKCNPELGAEVRAHLVEMGLETPQVGWTTGNLPVYHPAIAHQALEEGVHRAFQHLGLDVNRDPSIMDTPRRYATMFVGELTKGLNYDFFPKCTATPNGIKRPVERPVTSESVGGSDSEPKLHTVGAYNQMVLVERIRTTSLCEHHLQTIDGFTHIAYIPKHKVLGLSKFARVAEFFAARPQIQERMTDQIYEALRFILGTDDIAVSVRAVHFCMRARGVKQPESWTTTNKLGGRFLSNPSLKEEFDSAINRGS